MVTIVQQEIMRNWIIDKIENDQIAFDDMVNEFITTFSAYGDAEYLINFCFDVTNEVIN